MTQKKSLGRRKIEIKKIEKNKGLQVSFSKRRKGLFKKASELCVLTGAEIAILVQSPGNHVYAFGHPDVDSVIDTYLGNNVSNSSIVTKKYPTRMHEDYNDKYLEIAKELEAEKIKSDHVGESDEFWWQNSFEDLEIDELEHYIESMEQLKNNVTNRADELRNLVTNTDSSNVDGLNFVTDSSNVDGLLGDQVTFTNLDELLPYNVGVTNEDFTMMQAFHNSIVANNFNFGNGEFVLDDHSDTNYQGSSDFGVPNENNFGQGLI